VAPVGGGACAHVELSQYDLNLADIPEAWRHKKRLSALQYQFGDIEEKR
jgi:hypothetical protein